MGTAFESPEQLQDPRSFIQTLRLAGSPAKDRSREGVPNFGAIQTIASMPRCVLEFLRSGKPPEVSKEIWDDVTDRWETELALPEVLEKPLTSAEHTDVENWFASFIERTELPLHDEHDGDFLVKPAKPKAIPESETQEFSHFEKAA